MAEPPAPMVNSALAYFAAELRWWRERSGVTQDELGTLTNVSRQYVSLVELGRRFPARDFVDGADRQLQADGVLSRLYALVAAEQGTVGVIAGEADPRRLALRLVLALGTDPGQVEAHLAASRAAGRRVYRIDL